MIEKRVFERKSGITRVEFSHPAVGTVVVPIKNLSEGGMLADLSSLPRLPVGTVLQARFKRSTGTVNETSVAMKVVHHSNGYTGLRFV